MNIATFITARLKSKRLKKKVLLPIMGKPMIGHLIDRLRLSNESKKIVICTSTVTQDDELESFAKEYGVDCFRGHPDDVMVRLRDAATKYKIDLISSCTADNPLIDPVSMDDLIKYHIDGNYDFSKSENIPFGTFTMAVNSNSLNQACKIKDSIDTEFWPQYFLKTDFFKIGTLIHEDKKIARPELRLTVDEKSDFDLINKIFQNLYCKNKVFSLYEVVNFLDSNPMFKNINSLVLQKTPLPIHLKKKMTTIHEVTV